MPHFWGLACITCILPASGIHHPHVSRRAGFFHIPNQASRFLAPWTFRKRTGGAVPDAATSSRRLTRENRVLWVSCCGCLVGVLLWVSCGFLLWMCCCIIEVVVPYSLGQIDPFSPLQVPSGLPSNKRHQLPQELQKRCPFFHRSLEIRQQSLPFTSSWPCCCVFLSLR